MAYGNQGFGHVAFVLRSASLDFPSFSPDDGQSTQHGLQHAASWQRDCKTCGMENGRLSRSAKPAQLI
jgi:hypothetical protein